MEVVSQRALTALMAPTKRANIKAAGETAILGEQQCESVLCGGYTTKRACHRDHVITPFLTCSDGLNTLQAVCLCNTIAGRAMPRL